MNATNRTEYLQELASRYIAEHGPTDRRMIAAWAYRNKMIVPDELDMIDLIASEMAQAMRTEYFIDPQGRKVRKKLSVQKKVANEWGVLKQTSLWGDAESADEDFMHLHFSQRRRRIKGECHQMKSDADSYNENRDPVNPIQYDFNFNVDLEEDAGSASHPDFDLEDDEDGKPL